MELATVAAIAPVVFSLLKKIGKFVDVKDGEKKKLNNDNQQQKDVLKKGRMNNYSYYFCCNLK